MSTHTLHTHSLPLPCTLWKRVQGLYIRRGMYSDLTLSTAFAVPPAARHAAAHTRICLKIGGSMQALCSTHTHTSPQVPSARAHKRNSCPTCTSIPCCIQQGCQPAMQALPSTTTRMQQLACASSSSTFCCGHRMSTASRHSITVPSQMMCPVQHSAPYC